MGKRFLVDGRTVALAGASRFDALLSDVEPGNDGRPAELLILDLDQGIDLRFEPSNQRAVLAVGGDAALVALLRAVAGPGFRHVPAITDREHLVAEVAASFVAPTVRILAIGAHPDDVEIACGGTLLGHADRGDAVTVLTLSRGAQGGDATVREQEALRAAALMGATLRLHDLPDAGIDCAPRTIGLIEAAIRDFAPTHIFTHSAEDTHQDHRAIHAATLVAGRQVPHLFSYQSPSTTAAFVPNLFCDIDATLDRKLDLIHCYQSQTDHRANLADELIKATARYWGRFAGYGYVEPFCVIRARI